jgi:uncharacterized protein (DUF58 family)
MVTSPKDKTRSRDSAGRFLDPKLLQRLGRLPLIAKTIVEGFLAGLHVSPYHGFSAEFAQYRQYIPGDDLRHLDWRVFARTDRYYIRQFEEDTNLNCYILLDISGSMSYRPGAMTKLEYSAILAATLAYLQMKQRDNTGFYAFNEKFVDVIPPKGGQRHLALLLHTLESLKAAGTANVGSIIMNAAENFRRRGLVILISDLYDDPESVVKALSRVRHLGHEVIVFHLMDHVERNLAVKGVVEFVDLETGERVVGDAAKIRKAYSDRLEQSLGYYKRQCLKEDVDYVLIDTSQPLDGALYAYLKRRQGKIRN